MNRLTEIETRLAEIKGLMTEENADLDALTIETDSLIEERTALIDAAEKRNAILSKVASGEAGTTIEKENITMEENRTFAIDSKEYRNAFLNHLRGLDLNEEEKRAFATNNGAIATMTANDIISVVRTNAPLLDKMSVIYSAGQIKYYFEGTTNPAAAHTENAAITPDADTLGSVTLNPAEITKLIQVSEAARLMSVDAFESWIAKTLGEVIAQKINDTICTVAVAAATATGTTYTAADVQTLLGSVEGNVSIVCNRKTLYTKLLPLQDNSKSSIVKFDGGQATVYGVPVLVEGSMGDNVTLAGDLKNLVAAMGENVAIRSEYDIKSNSYLYLGVALFDVKATTANQMSKIEP